MTINQVYQELEELQIKYSKVVNTLSILENKVVRLEKENKKLKEENDRLRTENERLQKLNNILRRAIEIAIQIQNHESQVKHLTEVLEKLREWDQTGGENK